MWCDCPLLLWCYQPGLEETRTKEECQQLAHGVSLLGISNILEEPQSSLQNSFTPCTFSFPIPTWKFPGNHLIMQSTAEDLPPAKERSKDIKNRTNSKIKIITLSLLVFKTWRNKFCIGRMIVLKLYMSFFCFNFFKTGNISFLTAHPRRHV